MSEQPQNTSHIGIQQQHKFVKTKEIKDGLPVYEIALEDWVKLLESSEIVANIGD